MKTRTVTLKTVLIAAALAAAMIVSALAVELTVGWESFLGRTPEGAVTDIGVSAVTGDYTLTLHEAIVDDDGAAFLLALTQNDGEVLEGKPEFYRWDVKIDGEFPNMATECQQPIRSEDGKTVYYCVEFEAQGEEWDEESLMEKNITFLCGGVMDTDWTEEELALASETVSLAPLAQTARRVDMSYDDICIGQNDPALLTMVEELSAQAVVPLARPGEEKSSVSAVLFSDDGLMVAVDNWNGVAQQGKCRIGRGSAIALTDTRTGDKWSCSGFFKQGADGTGFYLSYFTDCPLTQEDLPYVDVTIGYQVNKVLSDEPVELSFSVSEGYQTTVALDEDITFNYIGDCTAHVTGASISALRLELTFDQMDRAGRDWENHPEKNTKWAVVEEDGTQVPLCPPMIHQDQETGAGYIRLEGVNENSDRRLIDPDQVEALMVGETLIPLK